MLLLIMHIYLATCCDIKYDQYKNKSWNVPFQKQKCNKKAFKNKNAIIKVFCLQNNAFFLCSMTKYLKDIIFKLKKNFFIFERHWEGGRWWKRVQQGSPTHWFIPRVCSIAGSGSWNSIQVSHMRGKDILIWNITC